MQQDLDLSEERITIVASKPIHLLGIAAGEEVVLDYTWEEISDLLDNLSNGFIWVVTGEGETLMLHGWIPNLDDIFTETTNEDY